MLRLNHQSRLTASECLEHLFFKNDYPSESLLTSSEKKKQINDYDENMRKFRKLWLYLLYDFDKNINIDFINNSILQIDWYKKTLIRNDPLVKYNINKFDKKCGGNQIWINSKDLN